MALLQLMVCFFGLGLFCWMLLKFFFWLGVQVFLASASTSCTFFSFFFRYWLIFRTAFLRGFTSSFLHFWWFSISHRRVLAFTSFPTSALLGSNFKVRVPSVMGATLLPFGSLLHCRGLFYRFWFSGSLFRVPLS